MKALNDFQAQHVESTFAHVDKLLNAVEALARVNSSPFARERSDISPEEARFLTAFAQQMRARMIAALDRLGLPRPVPRVSARHSADVTLRFAEVALADLSPSNLRGYGAVDPEAGAEVVALAADLRELIERGRALFREEESGGLAARLASLPGSFGDALRALERFSTEHALADVRPLIAEAAERVAAETFDVGVFGRVSAGKSSLINALIGTDVLPVGATPVTAVPLRLHHGELGAVVHFEDGASRPITTEEIAEYGTEERNPGNRARVRAIEIAVPTVPPGLRFLDTPGIGSLSASAPAQAFAWLPRCDLGLVLIAAGTAVGTDDLALVSGFVHAGITCEVLISKSDLLRPEQVTEMTAYVQRELKAVLGDAGDVAIRPVSTVAGVTGESSLTAFRAAVLEPLAATHAQALHQALCARLHRLVAMTRSALAESTEAGTASPARRGGDANDGAADADLRQQMRRDRAQAAIRTTTDALADSGMRVIEAAASAVASTWIEHRGARDAATAARAAIMREAGAALNAVRRTVEEAGGPDRPAGEAEKQTAGIAESATQGGDRRLPPMFDAQLLDKLPDLSPPRVLSGTRRTIAERRLASIRAALDSDLTRYAARLYAWGEHALKETLERETETSQTSRTSRTETTDVDPGVHALDGIDSMIDQS